MSLDVYLTLSSGDDAPLSGSGIFIRDNGMLREISRDEWDATFQGREPVVVCYNSQSSEVYSSNITHNLNRMALEAGIYAYLWRPDEIGITQASQLIEPLRSGLARLEAEPTRYRAFDPPNGWGDYAGLVGFVRDYLAECERYPDAHVKVSR